MKRLVTVLSIFAVAFCLTGIFPIARQAEAQGNAPRSVKGMKLKVSPSGRYLVDQDGKPFLYLGDVAWTLLKRLNHEEADEYLKNRADKGFTVIQTYVLRGLEVPNLYGDLTLIGRDPAKPNEAFFKNVDYI